MQHYYQNRPKQRYRQNRRKRRPMRMPVLVVSHIFVAGVFSMFGWTTAHRQQPHAVYLPPPYDATQKPTLTQESVMVVGGSMAHGWKDPEDNSYLKRAFSTLTSSTNTQYNYVDQTIIGNTAASMNQKDPNRFQSWLDTDNPQIVVISWGMMDDMYDKTPWNTFDQAIQQEIQASLSSGAIVLVVSPPVVKGSLSSAALAKEQQYISHEFAVAGQFKNPNVYRFDVFNQMLGYMQAHNQTIDPYFGDNWHPNSAGHELAGQLLYNDLISVFGQAPITVKTGSRAYPS